MVDTNVPLVKYLLSLKPGKGKRTDLKAGIIANADFILLALHALGPFGLTELRQLSEAWLGDKRLITYFGPNGGYTATDFFFNKKYVEGYLCSGSYHIAHKPYWFRAIASDRGAHRRYANAITLEGCRRLQQLVGDLPDGVLP